MKSLGSSFTEWKGTLIILAAVDNMLPNVIDVEQAILDRAEGKVNTNDAMPSWRFFCFVSLVYCARIMPPYVVRQYQSWRNALKCCPVLNLTTSRIQIMKLSQC